MGHLDTAPIRSLEEDINLFRGDQKAAEELLWKVERLTNDLVNDTLANRYCRRRTTVEGRLNELLRPINDLKCRVDHLNSQDQIDVEEAKLLTDECLCAVCGIADYYLFHENALKSKANKVRSTAGKLANSLKHLKTRLVPKDIKLLAPAIDEVVRIDDLLENHCSDSMNVHCKENVSPTVTDGHFEQKPVFVENATNEAVVTEVKETDDRRSLVASDITVNLPVQKLPYYFQLVKHHLKIDAIKSVPYSRYFTTVWRSVMSHLKDLTHVALHCLYLLNIHVAIDRLGNALHRKSDRIGQGSKELDDEDSRKVAEIFKDYTHRLECHHNRLREFNCVCFENQTTKEEGGVFDNHKCV